MKFLFRFHVVVALLCCVLAATFLVGCGSSEAEAGDGGGYTGYGMAECVVDDVEITYPVYLVVKTDENGVILSVEDDGTEVPDGKDAKYKKAQALFEELVGKNAETFSSIDAISGATYSSGAILSAVEQAFQKITEAKNTD